MSFIPSASLFLSPPEYFHALSLAIPIPKIDKHSFRMIVDLNPSICIGESLNGTRNWISFKGGWFEGDFGRGEVLPGGQDTQLILSSTHATAPFSALLSTRYLLKTTDEVYIEITTRGWRTGPGEVMRRLAKAAKGGEEARGIEVPRVDEYRFRLFCEMETGENNVKYSHLNQSMWVGSGIRSGNQVIYDAYLVE